MNGLSNGLSASLVLLMLMAMGYGMGMKGWMTAAEKRFISRFLINIAIPCNSIAGLLTNLDHDSLGQAGKMILANWLGIWVMMLLSWVVAWGMRLSPEHRKLFVVMASFSNAIFVGVPMCTQLFGQACIPYVMMYYLANTSLSQSVGMALVERAGVGGGVSSPAAVFKQIFGKPPVIAVAVAIGLLLLDIQLPGPVMSWADYVSKALSPLALMYCGYIMYELGLKNIRLSKGLPAMLVMRLAVAPAVCGCFCALFRIDGMARAVFLVESALPVMGQLPVMAGAFGADERYAAIGNCLSVLCSFLTIPLLVAVMG